MIVIVKKQRQAQLSAKTLIDFTNIMVETDFGQASHRAEHDEIVFEMKNDAPNGKDKSSDEYRFNKSSSKVRQRKRSTSNSASNDDKQGSTNVDMGIELTDITGASKKKDYQLDDSEKMHANDE